MKTKDINQSVIRGLAALCILFSHIYNFTSKDCVFRVFIDYGYLCVGIFFFYSGFNMINSYIKKENFFENFWKKKLIKIYLTFILSNILFLIVKHFGFNTQYNLKETISYIFGIRCLNKKNWYLYAIFLFYLSLWMNFKIFNSYAKSKKKPHILIISSVIFITYSFMYYIISRKIDISKSVCNIFPVSLGIGMVYAIYKDEITSFFENKAIFETCIFISFVLFSILHYANMQDIRFLNLKEKIILFLVPIFFTIFIMLITSRVKLDSKIFRSFDYISLETYTFHFVILNLLSNNIIKIENDYLFLLIYLILTIVISILVKKFTDMLLNSKTIKNNKKKIKKIEVGIN